jgi:asparagine synthase (glutamine-hydrolysing)
MCGYTITREKIANKLAHRGIVENYNNIKDWNCIFNSLPLSSYKTGLIQPIEEDGLSLFFNGEIFNYKELNKYSHSDLHYLKNLIYKSKGDILKIYKESLKWDGFWAITIINKNGDLYCFTDPMGKKQLYYSNNGISSEIKPLIDNNKYLYYTEKNFGTFNTNFEKIYRFMPGDLYLYKKQLFLPYKIDGLKYFYKINSNNLFELIDRSIKRRLENRYDGISILISGGLDSNIILNHALKYTRDIDLISIENGESDNVNRICELYKLDCNFIEDKYNEDDLKNALYFYEHSLDYGSLMPNYLLFKNCKNSLVLTGDGSDEIFGGYSRNLYSDTWYYDVMMELRFYHNIRIDRTSMAFTKEARSPLMSIDLVRASMGIKWEHRKNKGVLRDLYKDILPDFIVNGNKKPLRIKNDKQYNMDLIKKEHFEVWQNR